MTATVGSKAMLQAPIQGVLWRMTWPVVIGIATLISFNVVDTFFVGLLGTEPLAAVSFTFPVTFTLISLTIGLGIGTSAVIARKTGAGKNTEAHFDGTIALIVAAVLMGILAAAGYLLMDPIFAALQAQSHLLPYIHDYMSWWYAGAVLLVTPMIGNAILRASGDTKTPSLIMASGGLLNAIFDPILIFGWGPIPAYGVEGAAMASVLSWAIGVLLVLSYLIRKQLLGWHPPAGSTRRLEAIRASQQILTIGLPAAGANMLTPLAMAVMTAIIASYGDAAVAAFGVGTRIESLASIIVLSLSMSLPPLISQNFGAQQMSRVGQAYRLALGHVLWIQAFIYLVLVLLAPWIAAAFSQEPAVAELIRLFIYIMPLSYGLQGWIILTNSSLNALHLPLHALGLSIVRLFVMFVPLSYLGAWLADIPGLFWGGVVANLITAMIAYLWFQRTLTQASSTVGNLS